MAELQNNNNRHIHLCTCDRPVCGCCYSSRLFIATSTVKFTNTSCILLEKLYFTCNHCISIQFYQSTITEVYLLCCIRRSLWSTAVYSKFMYHICQSYNAYETAAYSQKRLPTRLFLAECFCISRSLYNINEVFSFLFQLTFDVFRSMATETGDPINTTQQVAWPQRMQHGVAHVGT